MSTSTRKFAGIAASIVTLDAAVAVGGGHLALTYALLFGGLCGLIWGVLAR